MRVFITGADGFIGSHLTEHLLGKGFQVNALVFYNFRNSWGWLDYSKYKSSKKLKVISGDIRDPKLIKSSMIGCDAVINLAALIGIPYSYVSPLSYIQTNILGTYNILEAAKDLKLKKIIQTSTSEVYGSPNTVPIKETDQLKGQSPYSASKISADQIALSYFYSFNMPVTIIRPFNTFGPRQSPRAIIPTIILQSLEKNKMIKLGSLNTTRDFNFVEDITKAFYLSLVKNKLDGEVINLGSGFEITIKNLIKEIGSLMNKKLQVITDKGRIRPKNSEVLRLKADTKKAKKLLKWSPQFQGVTGLRKNLIKTIKWYESKDHRKMFKSSIYNI